MIFWTYRKHKNSIGRSLYCVCLLICMCGIFLLALNIMPVAAKEIRIAVLSSSNSKPYLETLAGFRQFLENQIMEISIDEYFLENIQGKEQQVFESLASNNTDLLVTLGEVATKTAVQGISQIPIVAGMILNKESIEGTKNATAVVLEYPLEVQFEWLKKFFPNIRTVGVVYNPEQNQKKPTYMTSSSRQNY